ncbi:hypothetical protein ACH4Y0_34525 [Streptomyces sp. NPDC020707]|uniref:hypothetical protein n=1 Tax=Streptomyces sp. NPDC020707 TaxID=3365084 RepID=UPI0037A4E9B3
MSRRTRMAIGIALGGAALLALGVLFVRVGLERADQLSSVIGVFVGIVGFALAVYGVVGARNGSRPPAPIPAPSSPRREGVTNIVRGSAIGGNAVMAGAVGSELAGPGVPAGDESTSNTLEDSMVVGDLTQAREVSVPQTPRPSAHPHGEGPGAPPSATTR